MRARGEKPAPVTADVFVNDTRVGRQSFDAASLTSPNPVIVEAPAGEGVNTVRIEKRGEGALYFDASVRYYDKPAAESRTGSRSLALVRRYSTLVPVQARGRTVYRERPFGGTDGPVRPDPDRSDGPRQRADRGLVGQQVRSDVDRQALERARGVERFVVVEV